MGSSASAGAFFAFAAAAPGRREIEPTFRGEGVGRTGEHVGREHQLDGALNVTLVRAPWAALENRDRGNFRAQRDRGEDAVLDSCLHGGHFW